MAWLDQRQHLVGKTVQGAFIEHDELCLDFGGGWHLVVINPFSLVPEPPLALIGAQLVTFEERGTTEFLAFGDGSTITVDMRDDVYRGPEAMRLIGGGTSVIWN